METPLADVNRTRNGRLILSGSLLVIINSTAFDRRQMFMNAVMRLDEVPLEDRDLVASLIKERYAGELIDRRILVALNRYPEVKTRLERINRAVVVSKSADRERAEALLRSYSAVKKAPRLDITSFLLGFVSAQLVLSELIGMFWIMAMRTSLTFRLAGMSLVRARDGILAPRRIWIYRSLARILLFAVTISMFAVTSALLAVTVFGTVYLAGVIWTIYNPYRGPLEILTGTLAVRD